MRPRAIPLAMITMRKSINGFPLLSYMGMGLWDPRDFLHKFKATLTMFDEIHFLSKQFSYIFYLLFNFSTVYI